MTQAKDSFKRVSPLRVRDGFATTASRDIPEETAVALVHDGATFAVMMATPADIEDFAIGLSLSEGVIEDAAQVRDMEVVVNEYGVEARLWLDRPAGVALAARRRALAGPTGCGLCGVESLQAVTAAPAPDVLTGGAVVTPADVTAMLEALSAAQALGNATRAVHAAGFWTRTEGLVVMREDVGRHNALDKVAGALARAGRDGQGGVVVLTSRVSIDMLQKTLRLGAAVIVAVSAPTSMAVRNAQAAGLTLIAVAREDGFEVFTHPHRVMLS
jgi:FdhD protein